MRCSSYGIIWRLFGIDQDISPLFLGKIPLLILPMMILASLTTCQPISALHTRLFLYGRGSSFFHLLSPCSCSEATDLRYRYGTRHLFLLNVLLLD